MSMSEIFEEANFTLENRRIDSEVRLQEHIDEINRKFPELASIDKEISDLTQQQLLKSLNGENVTDIPDRIEVLEEKRAELRMKYGLCDSDFRPQPYCSVCGDTGMVEVNEDGKTIRRPCSCICEILAPTLLSLGASVSIRICHLRKAQLLSLPRIRREKKYILPSKYWLSASRSRIWCFSGLPDRERLLLR